MTPIDGPSGLHPRSASIDRPGAAQIHICSTALGPRCTGHQRGDDRGMASTSAQLVYWNSLSWIYRSFQGQPRFTPSIGCESEE